VENTYSREFPGGFSCDQGSVYKSALYFHFTCTFVAAILAFFFLSKLVLAWRVVSDDLLNPVTATPVGVICITLEVLFAVSGNLGMCLVFAVSFFHAIFAFWYLYVAAFKFNLLPDPSWFPGTVGLAYAAVKCWIYSNILGKAFLGVSANPFKLRWRWSWKRSHLFVIPAVPGILFWNILHKYHSRGFE
jgi:hypothetical protein